MAGYDVDLSKLKLLSPQSISTPTAPPILDTASPWEGFSRTPTPFAPNILQGPIQQPTTAVPQFRIVSASNPPNTTNTSPFRTARYTATAAATIIGTSTATPTFIIAQEIHMPKKQGPFRALVSYSMNISESTSTAASVVAQVSDGYTPFAISTWGVVSSSQVTGAAYSESSPNIYSANQSVVFTLQSYVSNNAATYTSNNAKLHIVLLPA